MVNRTRPTVSICQVYPIIPALFPGQFALQASRGDLEPSTIVQG